MKVQLVNWKLERSSRSLIALSVGGHRGTVGGHSGVEETRRDSHDSRGF